MVDRVVDGDSFRGTREGQPLELRLVGINAPEVDECFGEEAGRHLEALIGDRTVEVSGLDDTDQFGRVLVQVTLDGTSINRDMVESGYAIATSQADFFTAQESAREDERGLWSRRACGAGDEPLPDLTIVSIDFDPPGADENETVVIRNKSEEMVELDGFVLRDESSVNRFVFPSTTVSPGRELTVRTGCGTDDGGLVHWCANHPVWNNSGDSALLLDSHGRVIAFFRY